MSSKGLQHFLKAARNIIKSTSRQVKSGQATSRDNSHASARHGHVGPANFQLSGWINSCWIQFGQLGKLPKSKFHAHYNPNSTSDQFSSWNTLLKRSLRRKHSSNSSEKLSPDTSSPFPPLPNKFKGMDYFQYIFKPVGFTAFVGTASVIGCTIWQYEEYRCHVNRSRFSVSDLTSNLGSCDGPQIPPNRSQNEIINRVQTWWKELPPAEKVFWPICALNGAVFLAWRTGLFSRAMISYFSCSPTSRAICLPMLFSTFSHYSFFHLAANMFVLHSFLPGMCGLTLAGVQIMGKEQFVAYYLTSGTVASLASHLHKLAIRSNIPSLGASGAIMGILGLVCTRMPDTQLGIIFLPGVQFSADTALKCIMAVDTVGLLAGWKFMDHAAHLAGCLFGVGFSHYGKDTFWVMRDKVMTLWHKLRTEQL